MLEHIWPSKLDITTIVSRILPEEASITVIEVFLIKCSWHVADKKKQQNLEITSGKDFQCHNSQLQQIFVI